MFCGVNDPSWNEDALDLHYWKDCPLLAPCLACAQVVEVAGMADHLLEECEHKGQYKSCNITGLAVSHTFTSNLSVLLFMLACMFDDV